ncbi:MAG: CDP-archaeol synthase [Candidatus Paracaedimonas acanthamoebae]|uniref:Phosphatidate cytidylyltransferase n=1 Tax=Candidatus Paracaedimonas acanthamoebae TaxID=244581 RepID=A0A8J7PJQ2_9PROT|nr:CDP-archaeol synthase [Candidatus Paracaedimonas acanthamoebae]
MLSQNTNNANVASEKSLLKSNFVQRTLTTLILGSLSIFTLLQGYPYGHFYIGIFILGAFIEWGRLIFSARSRWLSRLTWFVPGFLFILFSSIGLSSLLYENAYVFVGMLLLVWSTDIGAYLCGRWLKGPKLAPSISPNKTWSGAIGGVVMCLSVAVIFAQFNSTYLQTLSWFLKHALLISIVSQMGDLFESWVKRKLGVKDSGSIIPGHGGILDRLDSVLTIGFGYFWIRLLW